jgi:replicative DNA helicase Mcm
MTDDLDILDEESQRVNMWDETDSGILRSVHAYLVWHSGSGFRSSITDKNERSIYLDQLADEASIHASDNGYVMSDDRRVRSLLSLDTQTQHEPGESPVCYLDIQLIESGFVLPFVTPPNLSLEPLKLGYPRYADYAEFKETYKMLAYYIQFYPGEVDYQLMRLQREYLPLANYEFKQDVGSFHFIPPEWRIVGVPCQRDRKLGKLNMAYDVGQVVKLSGQIIEISEKKTTFGVIAWKCKDVNCRQVHFVEQDSFLNTVSKPEPSCGKYQEQQMGESNGCNSKHFIRLPPPMSNAIELQRLTIQEETLENGEARTLKLEIRGALCDTLNAGQGIEVVGVLMTEPVSKGSLLEDKFLLVRSVTEKTDLFSQITVTDSDREEIETFTTSYTLEERMTSIIDWWAGGIHSEDAIKKCIILQQCSGTYNAFSKTGGNIHILLVGDPGTAKTKLLELATALHPQSRFVNAENSTQAGLTGACLQVEDMYTGKKQWALQPGALALTHRDATCAIDELNLYKGDMGDFNTALESGKVYINKVVKGTVKTEASVICGANPDNGNRKKWIRGEQLSYSDQIKLEFTLMQRFAAIYILEDIPDYDRDIKIGFAMTKGITEGEDVDIDDSKLDFIKKYLAVAREFQPKLTPAAQKYIAEEHARKRAENQGGSDALRSHRQVNALSRITTAVAKFDFSKKATMKHVKYAETLMAVTLEEKDPGLMTTGMTQAERELKEKSELEIKTYFGNLTLEEKQINHTLEMIHAKVSEALSGKGWRQPTLLELRQLVYNFADKSSSIEDLGNDRYMILEGE